MLSITDSVNTERVGHQHKLTNIVAIHFYSAIIIDVSAMVANEARRTQPPPPCFSGDRCRQRFTAGVNYQSPEWDLLDLFRIPITCIPSGYIFSIKIFLCFIDAEQKDIIVRWVSTLYGPNIASSRQVYVIRFIISDPRYPLFVLIAETVVNSTFKYVRRADVSHVTSLY